jgi:hypothetical protein
MNRQDPWDWSTPFKVDPQLQALTAQVVPVGNQNNMSAPPPIANPPTPLQQALSNRVINRGLNEVIPETPKAPHDPSKVIVEDRVPAPTTPAQVSEVPTGGVQSTGNQLAAAGGGDQLLAGGAEAQAMLDAQLAAASAASEGGLLSMLSSAAAAA